MSTACPSGTFRRAAGWISLGWGGGGLVLLLIWPLPGWTPALGWSPWFWLVAAPASVLAALWLSRIEPALPRRRAAETGAR